MSLCHTNKAGEHTDAECGTRTLGCHRSALCQVGVRSAGEKSEPGHLATLVRAEHNGKSRRNQTYVKFFLFNCWCALIFLYIFVCATKSVRRGAKSHMDNVHFDASAESCQTRHDQVRVRQRYDYLSWLSNFCRTTINNVCQRFHTQM